jgi:NTE family protein
LSSDRVVGAGSASWHRRLLRRGTAKRLLSLALQGGGSFGAFTWGVLDRLLEQDTVALDAVSGTSAGALNAVVLANGLAEGGPAEARARLERFWERLSNAASLAPFARRDDAWAGSNWAGSVATAALELSTRVVSPYHFNLLGLNPLRDILAEEVDFERLRAGSPIRLLIATTRVKDGRSRLFRDDEITLEAVLASTCLPHLHHAVEIEGEWYWDGGYSANPPLRQLVIDAKADDILLVQVTPETQEDVLRLSRDIARRVSQIAFNSPLQKEVEALADRHCVMPRTARQTQRGDALVGDRVVDLVH